MDLLIPGGVVEIHALQQINVPTITTINLVNIKVDARKTEVAYVWSGGCVFKLEGVAECGCGIVGLAPGTRMTSMALQNLTNAPGMRIVPSQPKVLLLGP